MSYNVEYMMAEKKEGLNWLTGGEMIGVAVLFDGVIIVLDIVLFGFGFILTWIPSMFAILTFSVWLAIKGEANFKKIAILVAPFTAGCTGLPGWTATIWPLVAKTIAAKTLGKIAPVAGRALNKI